MHGYTPTMPQPGEHHPAFEEYCECIFELAEDDMDVIQARIAERLHVSRPAVSEMIKRMEHEGLVTTAKGKIKLAHRGRSLAEQVVRRHRLAERFLTDILGLSWADAHQEAGRWEHVISNSVEAAMNRITDQVLAQAGLVEWVVASFDLMHEIRAAKKVSGEEFARVADWLAFLGVPNEASLKG